MAVKMVLDKVLEKIRPDQVEVKQALDTAKSFLKKLNENLKNKKISAKAVFGGSFAKGTWLAGDYDVDIFVKFALKHKDDDLSKLLASALKSWKPEKIHGSRDYFWVKKNGIKFEIVPVLAINKSEQAKNVTDFSALHVAWVNGNSKKLKDDIRLFKQFCKANRVYGAESYITGFSGHVVDILVIYFKGFLNLLKAAVKWNIKKKIVIDHYNKLKGKALMLLNKSKIQGPLVLVDPIDENRNAAAALSQEKFDRFLKAAKAFLKKPDVDFFTPKIINVAKLKADGYVIVQAKPVKVKEAVAGGKLLQVFDFIKYNLKKFDFGVIDADWFWDKKDNALFWFKPEEKKLSDVAVHKGPPLKIKAAVKIFKAKYKKTFNKDDHIHTKIKREFQTPESLIKHLFKEKYVKERVVNISLIKN